MDDSPTLTGKLVRLEPLAMGHAASLARASEQDPSLYGLSPVPQGEDQARRYIETALSWKAAGTSVPFAILRADNGRVIGSSRFWNIERWNWPVGHKEHGRDTPDACEIGYTWFAADSLRTGANTESKFLMLQHAFEQWNVFRVCLHTDVRNERSRKAIERIGGRFEGILHSHRMAADFIPRDSARYSVTAAEWLGVKQRLLEKLVR